MVTDRLPCKRIEPKNSGLSPGRALDQGGRPNRDLCIVEMGESFLVQGLAFAAAGEAGTWAPVTIELTAAELAAPPPSSPRRPWWS